MASPLVPGAGTIRTCLLLAAGLLAGCSDVRRPAELNTALSLAEHGKFAEAEKTLQALRRRSPSAVIARMIQDTLRHVEAYRAAYERVDGELEDQLRQHTRPQVQLWAKERARAAEAAGERYVARAFRLRIGCLEELEQHVERVAEIPEPAPQKDAVTGGSEREMLGAVYEHLLQDIDALVAAGRFADAQRLLRQSLPLAGNARDALRDRLWKLEDEGKKRIASILKQAGILEMGGQEGQALRFLRREARAFPDVGALSGVHRAARELEQRLRQPAAKRPVELVDVVEEGRAAAGVPAVGASDDSGYKRRVRRELAKDARDAFDRRDYAKAAEHYLKAAELAKGLHYEHRYRALAGEAELMVLTIRALRQAINRERGSGAFRGVVFGYGEKADLLSADETGVRARIGKDIEVVPYHGIPDKALAPLLAKVATSADELIGAAVLAGRTLDKDGAERLLIRAYKADASKKPAIDRLLASLRGERPGRGGYVLAGGKFVSVRAKERAELAAKLAKTFQAIWTRSSDEARDKEWAKVKDRSDARALEIGIDALAAKKRELHERLVKSSTGKSLKKLRALRVELDKRRAHAKELIFDTVRYFYPYKPPAVSGAKAAEYAAVQKEVDARVAAVKEIWDGKGDVDVKLPARVSRDVRVYRWITRTLEDLGANPSDLDAELELLWARDAMNVRSFALDAKDREQIDLADGVIAENAKTFERLLAGEAIEPTEAELIRLTNEYRRMLGHRPLRCDERLVRAAHGHCAEMNQLGYFSHTSPTPGRRSPADRMRNEGYRRGGGENLSINRSPAGAIWAWRHSSGHHRNMLMASHRDIGTGNVGRYFAQNFGAGER